MPSIDSSMTVGVFKDEPQAQQALASLKSAGFKQVQFLHPGRAASHSGGLFSGIKRLFTGDNEGIAGNLTETGVSEGDARYYQQEYEAGRIIVTVRADGRKQEALDILRRYGAYDAFKRDPQSTNTTTPSTATTADTTTTADTVSTSETPSTFATTSNTEITQPSATSSTSAITQSTEAAPASEIAQPSATPSTSESTLPSVTASTSRNAQPVETIPASTTPPVVEQETNETDETLLTPPTEDMSGTYDRHRITLKEEQLNVSKQPVQTGEVELHKEVVTEQRTLDVPVTHEEVVVKQYAVSGNTSDTTPIGQGEEIRVPVTEERIEVTKTPVVTSEVTLEKRIVQETQRVTDTTRREELRVEQEGNAPIHGTPSDHSHYDKQKQSQAGKPRAKSRKRR